MSTSPAEDRFTVYCPDLDSHTGPWTLVEVAELLAGMRAERDCLHSHRIELIEVTND